MLPHEIDPESGARMVGGEIPEWTDPPAPELPLLSGMVDAVLAEAVAAAGEGVEVLLAGIPSATLQLASLPEARTTRLVRGLPDARNLAATGATVVCGALDRLHDAGDRFDVVVAVGGPEATLSPDSRQLDAAGWVTLVEGLLRPGGTAVVTVANPAGLDVLLTGGRELGPASWDRLTPLGDGETTGVLSAAPGTSILASYPDALAPTVLLDEAEAARATGTSQLAVRALATSRTQSLTGPAPLDAWSTAEALFRAGVATALAPGWLLVLGREAPEPPTIPAGSRLLESVLRDGVASGSHERVGDAVRSYAAWSASRADAPDVRDVLVLADGGHAVVPEPLARAGMAGGATSTLAGSLGGFAERACADGIVTLWPAPSPALVLRELLAMAGEDVPVVATTDAATELTVQPPDPAPAATGPAPTSWAAARHRLDAAESALGLTRRQVAWLEGTVRAKDRRIRTLERAIAIESSPAYKAVHQLGRPVPALKRRVRAYLDRRGATPR